MIASHHADGEYSSPVALTEDSYFEPVPFRRPRVDINRYVRQAAIETLRDALVRTLILMRDEVRETVSNDELISALSGTRVALIADSANIGSHSAQTAFVTAAMLMARSGHDVHLVCPPVAFAGPQPPLGRGQLVEELARVGRDLLQGRAFATEVPAGEVDIAIALGNSEISVRATRHIRLNASPWSGRLGDGSAMDIWDGGWWPLGGMAAAGLAHSLDPTVRQERLRCDTGVPFSPSINQACGGPLNTCSRMGRSSVTSDSPAAL